MNDINIEVHSRAFNKVYLPYLNYFNKHLILYGGAASGKSVFLATRTIIQVLQGGRNFLILRKVDKTVAGSVFNELIKVIITNHFESFFKINYTNHIIQCKNGYIIQCIGLDDPEKVKSITPPMGVFTDVWMEEATEFTPLDLSQIRIRLRGKTKNDLRKQVVLSFNPINILHHIKVNIFDNADERKKWEILKTTYKDNKFLTAQDVEEITGINDPVFKSIYENGEWGVLTDLIYNNWKVEEFEDNFKEYFHGLDPGYSAPFAYVKIGVKGDNIYIIDCIYEAEKRNSEKHYLIKDIVKNDYITVDSEDTELIADLKAWGMKVLPAKKGPGSVRAGIQWLRGKKIIISPKCQAFINEISMYKWKVDKDGNRLEDPYKKFDHCMDAMRYALENLIMANYNKKRVFAQALPYLY